MKLLQAARKGNQAAFGRLYDEQHLPLFRFAWRLTGSVADAEDIVQECFLALLRPDCPYDGERTPLRTYLFGAVRNQALKRVRGRFLSCPTDGAGREPTPLAQVIRAETSGPIAKGGEHAVYVFHQQGFESELKDTRLFLVGNAGPGWMHH